MKPTFLATAAVLFAAAIAVPASVADEARGRQIAEDYCQPCHAIGPTGASTHPDAPPFRQVVQRYDPELLAEALAEGIVVGHPDMPEFVLPPDEIDALLRYLKTLRP